jgi:hypothetical protein
MQFSDQRLLLRALNDERFHLVQFGSTSRFKPAGIMKNESRVAAEHHFIFDFVKSSLDDTQIGSHCNVKEQLPLPRVRRRTYRSEN